MNFAAFDVLIKISESYRPQIPSLSKHHYVDTLEKHDSQDEPMAQGGSWRFLFRTDQHGRQRTRESLMSSNFRARKVVDGCVDGDDGGTYRGGKSIEGDRERERGREREGERERDRERER